MASVMRGYSPTSGGLNNMSGAPPPGSHPGYPADPPAPDGFVGPGSMTMGLMDPATMGDLSTPLMAAGGLYRPQQPYRDYSRISVEEVPSQEPDQHGSSLKEPPFPVKLHKILSNPEFQECITWLPHGRSWRVLKPKAFEEKVVPQYFRHAKYASFMRQVNGWGFKRMTQGPDHNSYYHELFLRGLPLLAAKMRRSTRTKNPPMEVEASPDFYRISMFAPLPGEAQRGTPRETPPRSPPPAVGNNPEENEVASNRQGNRRKQDEAPNQPAPVSSSGSFVGSPTSSASLQPPVMQNPLDLGQQRLQGKDGILPPIYGSQLAPEWKETVMRQMTLGHPGLPGLALQYPADARMAHQAAAAQAQYGQPMLAGAPGMHAQDGFGRMSFQQQAQQQVLENQLLLAQMQAQIMQSKGPAPPVGREPGNDSTGSSPGAHEKLKSTRSG